MSDEPIGELGAARQLFSAVIGDVMDRLGMRHQFLPPEIRPLDEDTVLVGRAMPVEEVDIDPDDDLAPGSFGVMLQALDDLRPGEVYLAAGASPSYALWGELMSNRAIKLGAAGAVLDGFCRDTREIRALGFPTFSRGGYAQDQGPRGRVVDYRTRVTIGRVLVEPGDLVFGDLEGVCIVPQKAAAEVIRLASEKVEAESRARDHILAGGSAVEAFERYGVL